MKSNWKGRNMPQITDTDIDIEKTLNIVHNIARYISDIIVNRYNLRFADADKITIEDVINFAKIDLSLLINRLINNSSFEIGDVINENDGWIINWKANILNRNIDFKTRIQKEI